MCQNKGDILNLPTLPADIKNIKQNELILSAGVQFSVGWFDSRSGRLTWRNSRETIQERTKNDINSFRLRAAFRLLKEAGRQLVLYKEGKLNKKLTLIWVACIICLWRLILCQTNAMPAVSPKSQTIS